MSLESLDSDRLEELLLSSKENSFSLAEHSELNALLRENPEARKLAAAFLREESLLSEALAIAEAERQFTAEKENFASQREPISTPNKIWVAVATAACLTLLFTLVSKRSSHGSQTPEAVAESKGKVALPTLTEIDKEMKSGPNLVESHSERDDLPLTSEAPLKSPKEMSVTVSPPLEIRESFIPIEESTPALAAESLEATESVPPEQPASLAAPNETVLALISRSESTSSNWKAGTELKAGPFTLEQGTIEILIASPLKSEEPSKGESIYGEDDWEDPFPAGARIFLQGPAQFSLHSHHHLELLSGKLSAEVFPMTKGFRVTTEKLEVIDLGTRFAVSANAQEDASLHVYTGIVSGQVIGSQTEATNYHSADTVRLRSHSNLLEKIPFQANQFLPSPSWKGEILGHSSKIRVMEKAPRAVDEEGLFPGDQAVVFMERKSVTLRQDQAVFQKFGSKKGASEKVNLGTIPKGTEVTSYLIHFDGVDNDPSNKLAATIRFDSPILGVIFDDKELNETDRRFGASRTDYPREKGRGLEWADRILLHEDQRTLSFEFVGQLYDQARIFVAKDP